jgi:hypothetical protein
MVRLQQSVAAEGLDLFVVSAEESILYLSQQTSSTVLV